MANGSTNGVNGKNGVKVPLWAIGIIFALVANLVGFVASIATLKGDVQNTRSDVSEIKFTVGNIQDGMTDIPRLEEKCKGFERRISHLEDQD